MFCFALAMSLRRKVFLFHADLKGFMQIKIDFEIICVDLLQSLKICVKLFLFFSRRFCRFSGFFIYKILLLSSTPSIISSILLTSTPLHLYSILLLPFLLGEIFFSNQLHYKLWCKRHFLLGLGKVAFS